MKLQKLSVLLASTLFISFVHAQPLTAEEVFGAIDGESNYMEEYNFDEPSTERMNFSIAPTSDSASNEVLDTHDFWDNPGSLGEFD